MLRRLKKDGSFLSASDQRSETYIHSTPSGSDFYNHKGFFSNVLLAIVNYDYKFLFVDWGCQGRINDGGAFRNSSFNEALERNKLNLPDPAPHLTYTDPT